jgi:hypothetical protein
MTQTKLPEDMQHLELGGMLGPHIVPFLPILFAIFIPFTTCIQTHTIVLPDHSKVHNVLSHYYTFNLFCMIFYITLVLNH